MNINKIILAIVVLVALCISVPYACRNLRPKTSPPASRSASSFVVTWRSLSSNATMEAPAGPGPQTDPKSGATDMYAFIPHANSRGQVYPVWFQYAEKNKRVVATECRVGTGPWLPLIDLERDQVNPRDPQTGEALMPTTRMVQATEED
jgi:hypothetical protein